MTEVILSVFLVPLALLMFMLPLMFIFVVVDPSLDLRLSEWIKRLLTKKFKGDE